MGEGTALGIVKPQASADAGAMVVLRTWLIGAERRTHGPPVPVLTGIFGFPWRSSHLDAKCTIRDWERGSLGPGTRRVDRHHPVIPAPGCTCGIYASTDLLSTPAEDLLPAAVPIAVGFVELSGPKVRDGEILRAQGARIIGPLTIAPGRPPLNARLARWVGGDPRPGRIVDDGDRFRVLWHGAAVGTPYPTWVTEAAANLESRYRVPVISDARV
jgi:hypothetical protein